MVGRSKPRPNCVSLTGLDPSGTGTREFWIEKDLLAFFYKKGALSKWKSVLCVKEVFERPAVIFQGLQREGHEESFCYAGLASHSYSNDGHTIPPPDGYTFVFYVQPGDVIFRWDWEEADSNLTYPINYKDRFGPQLWPKT